MARIKIELPDSFYFTTSIPVRITDINYGGHVGNDSILSMIHEARLQFLRSHSYTELDVEGIGTIMSDVGIEFKNELFYGDVVIASVAAGGFSKVSFELYYKFEKVLRHSDSFKNLDEKNILVAIAKTGIVCYDYKKKKIAALPDKAKRRLSLES